MRESFKGTVEETAGFMGAYPLISAGILVCLTVILVIVGDITTHQAWPAIPLAFLFVIAGYLTHEDVNTPAYYSRRQKPSNRFKPFIFMLGAGAVGLLTADLSVERAPGLTEALLLTAIVAGYTLSLVVQFTSAIVRFLKT